MSGKYPGSDKNKNHLHLHTRLGKNHHHPCCNSHFYLHCQHNSTTSATQICPHINDSKAHNIIIQIPLIISHWLVHRRKNQDWHPIRVTYSWHQHFRDGADSLTICGCLKIKWEVFWACQKLFSNMWARQKMAHIYQQLTDIHPRSSLYYDHIMTRTSHTPIISLESKPK